MMPAQNRRTPIVLVVDDEEWNARSLESVLTGEGIAVLRAYTGKQSLDAARRVPPDAVLVAWHLPDTRGTDHCTRLRRIPAVGSSTPILLFSHTWLAPEAKAEGRRAGAWDVIGPRFDPSGFLPRLTALLNAKLEGEAVTARST